MIDLEPTTDSPYDIPMHASQCITASVFPSVSPQPSLTASPGGCRRLMKKRDVEIHYKTVTRRANSAQLLMAAHQAPLSLGLSRQEHWSGLPFLTPGNLPDPRIKPTSVVSPALQEDSLPLAPPVKPQINCTSMKNNNF